MPDQVRAASAATAVVGNSHPLAMAGVLIRGNETSVWTVEPPSPATRTAATDTAPAIDPEILENVEDRKPIADPDDNPYEVRAFHYVIASASRVPFETLLKSARRDLSYVHLFEDTRELRGQIIYLEGDLRRLLRFEPSRQLKKEGVKDHYEAWIFDRRYPSQALTHCLIFTELPPGIKPGENLDVPVRFAGYLFKRYRYRSGDKAVRDAPLLIGRSIGLMKAERETPTTGEIRQAFLIGFIVVGGMTAAVVVGLAWWYRRTDQRIRARLARVRPPEFGEAEGSAQNNGHA